MSAETEFLLMILSGPISSWGDITVGEIRSTWDRPSKSAVLGIVAAALGIERSETSKHLALHQGLGFAVGTVDRHAASPLRDFHTAQSRGRTSKPKWKTRAEELDVPSHDLNTILSQREYWQDRTAIVALWRVKEDGNDLHDILLALQLPRFHVYLGRKSCPPGKPFAASILQAATLKDALILYQTQQKTLAEEYALPDAQLAWPKFYWVDENCPGLAEGDLVTREVRRDMVRDRRYWHFSDRYEFCYDMRETADVSY